MAHIPLPPGLPGIIGPLAAYPKTAKPLGELADLPGLSKMIWESPDAAPIRPKLRSLLKIAGQVQKTPAHVNPEDVAIAKSLGHSDRDILDTVLITAMFCLFNRYVDGLGTFAPARGDSAYAEMGVRLARDGYQTGP